MRFSHHRDRSLHIILCTLQEKIQKCDSIAVEIDNYTLFRSYPRGNTKMPYAPVWSINDYTLFRSYPREKLKMPYTPGVETY